MPSNTCPKHSLIDSRHYLRRSIIFLLALLACCYLSEVIFSRDLLQTSNALIALLFCLICSGTIYKRIKYSKLYLWCPLTWFLTMATIQFGIGSLIYQFGSNEAIYHLNQIFTLNDHDLLRVHQLNIVTTLIIVSSYSLFSKKRKQLYKHNYIFDEKYSLLIFKIFTLISIPTIIIKFYYSEIEIIQYEQISILAISALIISFHLFAFDKKKYLPHLSMTLTILLIISITSFAKNYFMQIFLFATLSYFQITRRISYKQVSACILLLVSLFIWYQPISEVGRLSEGFNQQSPWEKILITYNLINAQPTTAQNSGELSTRDKIWSRQSLSPVQGLLIYYYNNGFKGTSLEAPWIHFIPRLLWPDKPITTDVARDFNERVFGTRTSSLAPSFNADAYWNGGWPLVFATIIFIGCLFAVLSHFSISRITIGDFRALPIIIWGVNLGRFVESFFAPTFLGGSVIMIAWWLLLKAII